MSRYIDADALKEYIGSVRAEFNFFDDDERARYEAHSKAIYLLDLYVNDAPSIDIVFCKECKHRPIKKDANEEDYGFNVIAPNEDERCPCLVEDGWYSWIPEDDFYCGYGEREDE